MKQIATIFGYKDNSNSQIERTELQQENQELKKENQELKDSLKEIKNQNEQQKILLMEDIKKKLQEIGNENNDLKKQIREKDQEIENLQFNVQFLQQNINFNLSEKNKQKSQIQQDKKYTDYLREYQEIKEKYENLEFQQKLGQVKIDELEESKKQLNNSLKEKNEEINQYRINQEFQIAYLKEQQKRSNEKCTELRNKSNNIMKYNTEWGEKYEKKSKLCQEQEEKINNLEIENKNLKQKLQQKEEEIESKNDKINNLQKSIEEQKQYIQKLSENGSNLQEQLNESQDKCKRLESELAKRLDEIKNLNQEILNQNTTINQINQKASQKMVEFETQINLVQEELTFEKQRKEQFISIIKDSAVRKLREDKIISPIEYLFRSEQNPFKFLENSNVQPKDSTASVEIIKEQYDQTLESLTQNLNFNLTNLVMREPAGQWIIKESIQINFEGTKRKGRLFQVMKSDYQYYTDSIFLIEQLAGYENIMMIDKAIQVAENNLIARVLANYFQKKIQEASIEAPCKFTFNEIFLLNIEEKYFIAEKLQKGEFIKLNQDQTLNIPDNVANYFYAFQIFTYIVTQQMLMVSNIQGVYNGSEYILYDPNISSPLDIMGVEDLAEQYINIIITNYKNNPMRYGKDYIQRLGYEF